MWRCGTRRATRQSRSYKRKAGWRAGLQTLRRLADLSTARGPATVSSRKNRRHRSWSIRAERNGSKPSDASTNRWKRGCGTIAGGRACKASARVGVAFSSGRLWREQCLEPVHGRSQLILLDGSGGIHVFGAGLGALANEGAAPDALVLRKNVHAFVGALITGVHVVALRQGNGGGADEERIETVDRACRIAERAVNAHAVLLVDL